jgi:hypothetical protein
MGFHNDVSSPPQFEIKQKHLNCWRSILGDSASVLRVKTCERDDYVNVECEELMALIMSANNPTVFISMLAHVLITIYPLHSLNFMTHTSSLCKMKAEWLFAFESVFALCFRLPLLTPLPKDTNRLASSHSSPVECCLNTHTPPSPAPCHTHYLHSLFIKLLGRNEHEIQLHSWDGSPKLRGLV